MKHRRLSPGGLIVAASLLFVSVCGASGCSLIDFGANDSFHEWYSGPRDAFEPQSVGCTSLDGTFCGYVLNDMLLRTPMLLVYETTRAGLIPLAAPWFWCADLLSGDQAESPEASSETAAPDVEDIAPEGT